jgi:hypothetical protein
LHSFSFFFPPSASLAVGRRASRENYYCKATILIQSGLHPMTPLASIRGGGNAVASSKKALDVLRGGQASSAGIATSQL